MSHRLTVTYRVMHDRETATRRTTETAPGRVVDLDVSHHYVRYGGLFYRLTGDEEGTEHMVPLDLLYHYASGPELPA